MTIPRKEEFEFNGNKFEIRVAGENNRFKVAAFFNDTQVSPVYSVDITTHLDYFTQHQGDLIEHLVSIAKSDIERGMYFKG